MKVLVFDVFGDFGHFKTFYTTSSPLSFSFPPPPTVRGMLGAICGVDKADYLRVFSHRSCQIAVSIQAPVKKVRMGLNLINTKGNYWTPVKKGTHEARTQVRTEFVKDPVYRLYVTHEDEAVFSTLLENVRRHRTVYTLSLGLSELLADFAYLGTSEAEEVDGEGPVPLHSVLPVSSVRSGGIVIEGEKKYFKERMPLTMTSDRVIEKYEDVIFEAQGRPIKAHVKAYWRLENDDTIVFF